MGEALFDISSLGLYLDDDHHVTPSTMDNIESPPCTKMGETLFDVSSHGLNLYVDQLALSLDQHIVFFF